ncbi:rho GTPase-activating protein 11A [Drosophila willistoni]|uniref:rho GTPase-activating protein 11A n=1 Tax=Drosophila willistoni TaxID=7260 RepID=UPI00017D8932|nr:rho GTPase-activating protein 11A [Drosophila willistoni]
MSNIFALSNLIINELKEIGVKHKEKKTKQTENKSSQRLFRQKLDYLRLTDAFLANGTVVQVPQFITEACSHILEHVDTEGIFRKAGSMAKQREIRKFLEAGLPLGKSHRVIDIANILSYFFRELPEPLIPVFIHETLLRCLQITERNRIKSIELTCLLLPALSLHTLAYFMQFLNTVTTHAEINKMTAENLAIVLAPSIMPYSDLNSLRFKNHIKVVQLLIHHANHIGTIPTNIREQLKAKNPSTPARSLGVTMHTQLKQRNATVEDSATKTANKKKKRRSEMFNGLKRIVGSAIGSLDNLDCSIDGSEKNDVFEDSKKKQPLGKQSNPLSTIMSQKRKFTEPLMFNSKRKDNKMSRLSLAGDQQIQNLPTSTGQTMERRWSLVSTGWAKKEAKRKELISNSSNTEKDDLNDAMCQLPTLDDSKPNTLDKSTDSDKIHIFKSEYEAIKQRVTAIENQISQEFEDVSQKVLLSPPDNLLNGPEVVQNKFEKILIETEAYAATEQLAQSLKKGLKITRRIDQQVIRSPSARKIGTIRRRSKERSRITRTKTWHVSGTSVINDPLSSNKPLPTIQVDTAVTPLKSSSKQNEEVISENWLPAETFFESLPSCHSVMATNDKLNSKYRNSQLYKCALYTPTFNNVKSTNAFPEICNTPMLPPKSVSVKRTPMCLSSRLAAATPSNEDNGRESIARLRSQNAGMVRAKAKHFDKLEDSAKSHNKSQEDGLNIDSDKRTAKAKINTQPGLNKTSANKNELFKETPKSVYKRPMISQKPGQAIKQLTHKSPRKLYPNNIENRFNLQFKNYKDSPQADKTKTTWK